MISSEGMCRAITVVLCKHKCELTTASNDYSIAVTIASNDYFIQPAAAPNAYFVDFMTSSSLSAFVYSFGEAPKQTDSSPSVTCRDSASGSVKTTTVGTPNDLADRITRREISPLFAINSLACPCAPIVEQIR